MLTCKLDGDRFEDKDAAMNHLRDTYPELIDEELQEFISEAEDRVFEDQFEEEE